MTISHVMLINTKAESFILKPPKAEQAQPHWQAATEAVIMAAG